MNRRIFLTATLGGIAVRASHWPSAMTGLAYKMQPELEQQTGAQSATPYSVRGRYYDTCACHVSCSCATQKVPFSSGHCDDIILVHVDSGRVGAVAVEGLNLALVGNLPSKEQAWKFVRYYLDDKASPPQRAVLPDLAATMFGGPATTRWVPMDLNVDGDIARFQIEKGRTVSFEIEKVVRGGSRIIIENAAPAPWIGPMTQGFSHSFKYSDEGVSWEYKQRNAFFAEVIADGMLSSPKK